MQRRMLAEDRKNLNWRNAFYMRIGIFAHETTLSEDGCKRCLQLRRLSSEYKFREEEERVGNRKRLGRLRSSGSLCDMKKNIKSRPGLSYNVNRHIYDIKIWLGDILCFCPHLCHSYSTNSSDSETNAGAAPWGAKVIFGPLISEMEDWIPLSQRWKPLLSLSLTGTFISYAKTNACRRQEELNRRNAFYVKIVIVAHKTSLSEDGCKRCLQLRQLSSEYKFRGEKKKRETGKDLLQNAYIFQQLFALHMDTKHASTSNSFRVTFLLNPAGDVLFFLSDYVLICATATPLRAPTVKQLQGLPHGAQKVIFGS
ncbi:hypothetical protein CEXT_350241 [Caerostris extrusa]|uniref:Uncharacterized protein n=1 Tax=Caerostris extrusa TaxID=172846 RepID=A0AAV4Y078_CAEEX|nr:hypothetical protein CEXT_350241 [Caerostris extrusa]